MTNKEALEIAQDAIRRISVEEERMCKEFCAQNNTSREVCDERIHNSYIYNSALIKVMYELEEAFKKGDGMKIADMFTQGWFDEHGGVDIINDVTDEWAPAFCGLELTEDGKARFSDVLGVKIHLANNSTVECELDALGDEWERAWNEIVLLFEAAAGYVDEETYNKWFVDLE